MNSEKRKNTLWRENVILVDGDFAGKVAFDLIVNFERMLERRIPDADIARWLDCIALDGGIRQGDNEVQAVIVHDRKSSRMENFTPSAYDGGLDGRAFRDDLGEFAIGAYAVEDIVTKEDYLCDIITTLLSSGGVKRLMVVVDEETYGMVRTTLGRYDGDCRITLFAMQPMQGGNYRQEILGYSLMNALGIRGDELK